MSQDYLDDADGDGSVSDLENYEEDAGGDGFDDDDFGDLDAAFGDATAGVVPEPEPGYPDGGFSQQVVYDQEFPENSDLQYMEFTQKQVPGNNHHREHKNVSFQTGPKQYPRKRRRVNPEEARNIGRLWEEHNPEKAAKATWISAADFHERFDTPIWSPPPKPKPRKPRWTDRMSREVESWNTCDIEMWAARTFQRKLSKRVVRCIKDGPTLLESTHKSLAEIGFNIKQDRRVVLKALKALERELAAREQKMKKHRRMSTASVTSGFSRGSAVSKKRRTHSLTNSMNFIPRDDGKRRRSSVDLFVDLESLTTENMRNICDTLGKETGDAVYKKDLKQVVRDAVSQLEVYKQKQISQEIVLSRELNAPSEASCRLRKGLKLKDFQTGTSEIRVEALPRPVDEAGQPLFVKELSFQLDRWGDFGDDYQEDDEKSFLENRVQAGGAGRRKRDKPRPASARPSPHADPYQRFEQTGTKPDVLGLLCEALGRDDIAPDSLVDFRTFCAVMAIFRETDEANLQTLFAYLDSLGRELPGHEGSGTVRIDNLFSQLVQQAKNTDRPGIRDSVVALIDGYIRPPASETRAGRKVKRGRKTQAAKLRDVFSTAKGQLSGAAFKRALAALGIQLPVIYEAQAVAETFNSFGVRRGRKYVISSRDFVPALLFLGRAYPGAEIDQEVERILFKALQAKQKQRRKQATAERKATKTRIMKRLGIAGQGPRWSPQRDADLAKMRAVAAQLFGQLDADEVYTDGSFSPEQYLIEGAKKANLTREHSERLAPEFEEGPVVRLSEIEEPDLPYQIERSGFRPTDVEVGGLEDTVFLSSLAVLAQRPEIIQNLFLTPAYNRQGAYKIRYYDAGRWTAVTVDDCLPTVTRNNETQVYGAQLVDNQIWVALLEKAWAKQYGNYNYLRRTSIADVFQEASGAPVERVEVGDADFDTEREWSKLGAALRSGYVVAAGTTDENLTKAGEELGLDRDYAYAVLDTAEVFETKVVQMRRPNTSSRWVGDWSEKDPRLDNPHLQDEFQKIADRNWRNYTNDDQYTFWISWSDVLKYFSEFVICKYERTWHVEEYESEFRRLRNCANQCYTVSVSQPTSAVITITQHLNVDSPRANDLGVFVFKCDGSKPKDTAQYTLVSAQWPSLETISSLGVDFPDSDGTYMVLPFRVSNFEKGPAFGVSIHTSHSVLTSIERPSETMLGPACNIALAASSDVCKTQTLTKNVDYVVMDRGATVWVQVNNRDKARSLEIKASTAQSEFLDSTRSRKSKSHDTVPAKSSQIIGVYSALRKQYSFKSTFVFRKRQDKKTTHDPPVGISRGGMFTPYEQAKPGRAGARFVPS